ncbi:Presenilin-like protein [Hibiscus syriacus]|uniref:Presenilin n=1 Tax=Hibiscus syriacus TaxID=106335 RepID=A0A6A2YFK6_HIBSY|nr:Presenilin-like protein [Hibiscus syriacus]
MAQNQRPKSLLDSLGEEIIRILTPVSICMFLVVLLISILNSSSSLSVTSIATIAYSETTSDSSWDKFLGALLNSLAFVAVVTVATFILVLFFYLRCTKFLKIYMGFSSFVVLGFMGGEIALFLTEKFSVPIDCITFFVLLFNFSVIGVLAVFMSKMAIAVTQGYLVLIGMLVAYWFTLLPEWTTWALLVAMALYDLAAVLLPVGPLRLLVELAMSREEDIPALVYEARPIMHHVPASGQVQRRIWRERRNVRLDSEGNSSSNSNVDVVSDSNSSVSIIQANHSGTRIARVEEGQVSERDAELSEPLIDQRMDDMSAESLMLESMGRLVRCYQAWTGGFHLLQRVSR